jgi:hypothetical protein
MIGENLCNDTKCPLGVIEMFWKHIEVKLVNHCVCILQHHLL